MGGPGDINHLPVFARGKGVNVRARMRKWGVCQPPGIGRRAPHVAQPPNGAVKWGGFFSRALKREADQGRPSLGLGRRWLSQQVSEGVLPARVMIRSPPLGGPFEKLLHASSACPQLEFAFPSLPPSPPACWQGCHAKQSRPPGCRFSPPPPPQGPTANRPAFVHSVLRYSREGKQNCPLHAVGGSKANLTSCVREKRQAGHCLSGTSTAQHSLLSAAFKLGPHQWVARPFQVGRKASWEDGTLPAQTFPRPSAPRQPRTASPEVSCSLQTTAALQELTCLPTTKASDTKLPAVLALEEKKATHRLPGLTGCKAA